MTTSIVLRDGSEVPGSLELLAQWIMATGLPPGRCYELALLVARQLPAGQVGVDDVRARTEEVLAAQEGDAPLARYRSWHALTRADRPLVLLIGGTAGTGKSTLATGLAHRLGITRLTSTDTIRHILRTCFSPEVMPDIHVSSFEAGRAVGRPRAGEDPDLLGFHLQTQPVGAAVRAIVQRAIGERTPLILEGVHLVPGVLGDELAEQALVVQLMLVVPDESVHRGHFEMRAEMEARGPVDRYVSQLGKIRKLQDHLVAEARSDGVPVIDAGPRDRVLAEALELVLEAAARSVPSPAA